MHELTVGVRPGHPQRLLLICAGVLLLTLGLSWNQMRLARALGPEQQVGQLPLWIRLPKGWQRDPNEPRAFNLPVIKEVWGRPYVVSDRRIVLTFDKFPTFESPGELRERLRLSAEQIHPARIGSFPAFDAIERIPTVIGRAHLFRERLTRVASLPNGYCVVVQYDALLDLTPGDLEQLDDICATLRIDEPALRQSAGYWLERAGVAVSAPPRAVLVGPELPETPGFFVGGESRGVLVWSLGVFRTFLAGERRPEDLIADFAAAQWLVWDTGPRIVRQRGNSGQEILLYTPPAQRLGGSTAGIIISTQSPTETLLILIFAQEDSARETALRAAVELAAQAELRPLERFGRLAEAADAGRRFADRLGQRGALPRWGRAMQTTTYVLRTAGGVEEIRVSRAPRQGEPERGYEGAVVWQDARPGRRPTVTATTRWEIDARAMEYRYQIERLHQLTRQVITEVRPRATDQVTRTMTIDGRLQPAQRFHVGPTFVAPPAQSIVHGWVARGEAPAALIECTSLVGPGAHRVLLEQLPPDGEFPRVFILDDFAPFGEILAFDDRRAETVYEWAPGWRTERVSGSTNQPR